MPPTEEWQDHSHAITDSRRSDSDTAEEKVVDRSKYRPVPAPDLRSLEGLSEDI